jgi:rhamnosyltransferase
MKMKNPETSIIIRTKNEQRWIGTVLEKLFKQTYKDFEVLIIDSGSTDKTLEIAKEFPVKIIQIAPEDFNYPYALNYAISHSQATKYIVSIVAHALPISNTWLSDGIENFSQFDKVCGVYGLVEALPDSTFWDKALQNGWSFIYRHIYPRQKIHKKAYMGVMGFTNAMFLKELWDKQHFDENYGAGGEEGPWIQYWFDRGYIVIQDVKFTVKHSHYLGLLGWIKQYKEWLSLAKPKPFRPLTYRKTPNHNVS